MSVTLVVILCINVFLPVAVCAPFCVIFSYAVLHRRRPCWNLGLIEYRKPELQTSQGWERSYFLLGRSIEAAESFNVSQWFSSCSILDV